MLHADVAILGSGFGGCLTALILDRIGLRPVVIDRAAHPRFAIGESSTPIADLILRQLATRYDLPRLRPLTAYGPWQEQYPHLVAGLKRGFSYFYHTPGEPFRPDARHRNELLVAASAGDYESDTHWLRADVDAFFAAEVRRAGLPLFERTEVAARLVENTWHLEGRSEGAPFACTATFVIDATGAGGVLPRMLRLDDGSAPFQTHSRALFAHFEGVRPWHEVLSENGARVDDHPFRCDDAALHHVFDGGWMWQLRFNNGVVSAGFALDPRRHPLDPGVSPEAEWRAWLDRFPSLRAQFAGSRLVDPPGRLIRTGRLQRRVLRAAGPNWALLPFTAGFVDPLHSTGIAHTIKGVEHLTGLLARHWGHPSLAEALDGYSRALLRELALIDGFVAACYEAARSFRLYTAAAMLYFAAVVTYEQERIQHDGMSSSRLFLGADDDRLVSIVAGARARLARLPADHPPTEDEMRAFEAYVEDAIAPYNTVGLFHPPQPNMYHHTAARPA